MTVNIVQEKESLFGAGFRLTICSIGSLLENLYLKNLSTGLI